MLRLWRMREFVKGEEGVVLPVAAVSMAVLFACMALAIDVGQMQYTKRKLQILADATAIAAGNELGVCSGTTNCTAMQNAVSASVTENGWSAITPGTNCATAATTGLSVSVNNGPCAITTDPNYGKKTYIETVVTYYQPTFFAGVLGYSKVPITARAEVYAYSAPTYCIYLTDPSQSGEVFVAALASIYANCGIAAYSNSSTAIENFLLASIQATKISTRGGYANWFGVISPTPTTHYAATPTDPLSSLPDPVTAGYASSSCGTFPYGAKTYTAVGGGQTIYPGTYCGGLTSIGGNIYMQPGTYYFKGGNFDLAVLSYVYGPGVTLYFDTGSLNITMASYMFLKAPTTGTYSGILYYENRSNTTGMTIAGLAGSYFEGSIYMPAAPLTIGLAAAATVYNNGAYTFLIADSINVIGLASFAIGSDYSSLPTGPPIQDPGGAATLVE